MVKSKQALDTITPYGTPKYAYDCKLKLDSNENPYGASEGVLSALREMSLEQISRYPHYGELVDKLAQKFALKDTQVLATNGADEALSVIINTYLDAGEEFLCYMPTFSMPKLYATACKGTFKSVDYYTKWVFDPDKLIEAADEKTKIIYITSPNNPTGEMASVKDIEAILLKFPEIALILDVTYINFASNPPDYYGLIKQYDNLFIVKSFSKDMGLAGLRLGVILSAEKNILQCKKVISPYSVNAAAISAGIASLCDTNRELYIKEKVKTAREMLFSGLIECGFKPYKSEANFILCDFGNYCNFVHKKLEAAGIKTRCFNSSKELENCLRITTPKVEDVEKIFSAIKKKDLLVFDLDGVVFNVENSYRLAIKETFKHFSSKELDENEIQKAKELGGLNCDWDLTQYLLKTHGFEIDYQEIKNVFQDIFFKPDKEGSKGLIDNESLAIPKEIFEKLYETYDFAVFTGRPKEEALYSLEKYGILQYFSKIITQDDLEKEKQKPNPEGLMRIKRETYYNKICYFGDTIDDIYSGIAAAIKVYGVAKQDSKTAQILLEAGAADILDDTSKLDEFLKSKENSYANN